MTYVIVIIVNKFSEQVMFRLSNAFGSRGNTLSLSINFACPRYHHLPSPFPKKKKTIKSYYHGTDLKNKNGSLHLHGGFHVINLNARLYFVTLPWHLTEPCTFLSGKPEMSMDSSILIY